MSDAPDIRHFGYRSPRYLFPETVNIEITQGTNIRVIGAHGIDISVDGIAVAADVLFDPAEPVTVVVPLRDNSVARLSGRVLCQSQHQCRFTFEFASVEQHEQLEALIVGLAGAHFPSSQ